MSRARTARREKARSAAMEPAVHSAGAPPRWLQIAALALAAICLLGWFSTEAGDTDFWWHLKTGQYIVEKHALPVPDPFAYTTAIVAASHPEEAQVRHFNLTHEWLAQALMYVAYLVGGFPLIVFSRALILAGICGLAGLLAARSSSVYTGIAAAFATASVIYIVRADRPTIVTFLFVAVFVTLLEFRYALWSLPVLELIWANCHGGFFLGWVVLLAYCIEIRAADRQRLWLITVVSIAVSGLNPNGFGVVSTLLGYRQSPMTANLLEWHSPYLWGPPYGFDILLYMSILALAVAWRKVRLAHWALFIAFAGASLAAFRNIPLMAFFAPVLIASYLLPRVGEAVPSALPVLRRSIPWATPLILAAAIIAGVADARFFRMRAAEWSTPAGAADFILANHIEGRMFNVWAQGGYLMWKLWPHERVFIDGRALSESLNRDYQQILNNPSGPFDKVAGPRATLLDRYGIEVVVMNTFEYASGGIYPLALALGNTATAGWQLVYDDPQGLVFLRNPPPGMPVLPDKFERVFNHMDTECAVHIEHDPDTASCARTQYEFWMRSRRPDRALPMLRLHLMHTPVRDELAEQWWERLGGGPLPKRF